MEHEFYDHTNYEYKPEDDSTRRTYKPEEFNNYERRGKSAGPKWLLCIAMAVVFGIVASFTYYASSLIWPEVIQNEIGNEINNAGGQEVANTQTNMNQSEGVAILSDVADVAEAVMPSVVSITNLSIQQVQDWFFGYQEYESQSSGSGIIIGQNDNELLIVTNNHVVTESTTLTVTFIDGTSTEAQIKGRDANIDVAIIAVPLKEVKKETKNAIKVAAIGDSDALRVGEPTIAIGNALGYGQSVTTGIVSAVQREIEGLETELIQTDAAINPGNSGGALLNAKGEVIGINTAKVQDTTVEGMGYAIPISDISETLDALMNRETKEKVPEEKRGMIGIEGTTVDEQISAVYNVPEGVFISKVVEDGGAEMAGISKGTVITHLEGISVSTIEQLQEELAYYCYGEKVTLKILVPQENGEYTEKEVEVVLQKASK